MIKLQNTHIRYAIVGIFNTVVAYSLFYVLDNYFTAIFPLRYLAYMTALIIMHMVGILLTFTMHKYFTFRSSAQASFMAKEFGRFIFLYMATIGLNFVLMPILVEVFHISPKLSSAALICLNIVIGYIGHSRFTFRSTTV
jgi:putative flippase GtrA